MWRSWPNFFSTRCCSFPQGAAPRAPASQVMLQMGTMIENAAHPHPAVNVILSRSRTEPLVRCRRLHEPRFHHGAPRPASRITANPAASGRWGESSAPLKLTPSSPRARMPPLLFVSNAEYAWTATAVPWKKPSTSAADRPASLPTCRRRRTTPPSALRARRPAPCHRRYSRERTVVESPSSAPFPRIRSMEPATASSAVCAPKMREDKKMMPEGFQLCECEQHVSSSFKF